MTEQDQHGLAHAAETWRELATRREQVALVLVCDVAARTDGAAGAAMVAAATLMVSGLMADAGVGPMGAAIMAQAAMHEARQRAGLPGVL